MNVRGLVLFGSLVGSALLGAVSSSCSGPDPGAIEYRERARTDLGTSSGVNPGDGGSGDEGGAADPVFGTTSFTPGQPPAPGRANTAAQGTHPANGVAGESCFQTGCHGPGEPGPDWAMAGTVYSTLTGGATVAGAEIRISGPDGTEYAKTYSDEDGNFWIDKPVSGDIPANSRVGVRNANNKMIMLATVTGNAGSACHAAGCHTPQMRIYLP